MLTSCPLQNVPFHLRIFAMKITPLNNARHSNHKVQLEKVTFCSCTFHKLRFDNENQHGKDMFYRDKVASWDNHISLCSNHGDETWSGKLVRNNGVVEIMDIQIRKG